MGELLVSLAGRFNVLTGTGLSHRNGKDVKTPSEIIRRPHHAVNDVAICRVGAERRLKPPVGRVIWLALQQRYLMKPENLYATPLASVYPHYVKKVESKGRTVGELGEVIGWLTGYDEAGLAKVIADRVDLRTFFERAPRLNPNVALIKGTVCGIRVEDIEDPLMQKIRWMDKLIDELAKGKKMEKILRTAE